MPAELSRRRLVMKTAPTGYVVLMGELSGPIPEQVAKDLEQLKLRLFDMRADELPNDQADALACEISAIRLHLKRLSLERERLR
jgi:hypothetical protein